jgi:hypothetical protein
MKFNQNWFFGIIITILFMFQYSNGSIVNQNIINLKATYQGNDASLCWAYSARSVLLYYQKDVSINDIVTYATNNCTDQNPCPDKNAGRALCTPFQGYRAVADILFVKGQIQTNCYGYLLMSTIKQSINKPYQKPIPAFWQHKDNAGNLIADGHVIVICGYGTEDKGTTATSDDYDVVFYMDPITGIIDKQSYSSFCENSKDKWTESLDILTDIRPNYASEAMKDAFNKLTSFGKGFLDLIEGRGGYLPDAVVTSCPPYALFPGCTPNAMLGGVNVHNTMSMMWLGNVEGDVFSFPISFPKTGKYTISISCRGSVLGWSTVSGDCSLCWSCLPPRRQITIKEVPKVATVSLFPGYNGNTISSNNAITGSQLDYVVYSGTDQFNNKIEFTCRPFTQNAVSTPADMVLSFEALIFNPGVENLSITLAYPGKDNKVGFSVNKIETQFVRDLTCGCKDPSANNKNMSADVDCGGCTYDPPSPALVIPPGLKTVTYTGNRSYWPVNRWCGSLQGNVSQPLKNYKITWGDGTTTEGTRESDYLNNPMPHTYTKKGVYTPFVEIEYICGCSTIYSCWTSQIPLGTVRVGMDITPVLNLLLGD